MKHVRHLCVGVFAVLAVYAIGASAALAVEVPEFLPNPTSTAPLIITGSGGAGHLNTKKSEIACTSNTSTFTFTSARHADGTVTFKGCKSMKVACKTAGAGAEEIVVPVLALLVDLEASSLLLLAVLLTIINSELKAAELTITCTGFTIKVKGSVIGETALEMCTAGSTTCLALGPTTTIKFAPKSATELQVQAIKTCHLTKADCEGKTYLLEANFSEAFEEAGLSQEATLTSETKWHVDY